MGNVTQKSKLVISQRTCLQFVAERRRPELFEGDHVNFDQHILGQAGDFNRGASRGRAA